MRRRRKTLQVSTFPFLAVLLCTMGALILVLVAMDRQSRLAAQQKAQQEAQRQLDDQVRVLADRRSDYEARKRALRQVWEKKRDALLARVGAEESALQTELKLVQMRLSRAARRIDDEEGDVQKLRDQLHAERERLLEEQKALDAARKEADAMTQRAASTDQTKAKLADELVRLEKALEDMRKARQRDAQTYSVIPYFGKRGENRRPLYVECSASSVIFHPDRVQLSDAALSEVKQEVARRAAAQKQRMAARGAADMRPYVMLLVRPTGIRCYYAVQSVVRELGIEYGYEFVDADWILQVPADAEPPPADQVATVSPPPRPAGSGANATSPGFSSTAGVRGASFGSGNPGATGPVLPGVGSPGESGSGRSASGPIGPERGNGPGGVFGPALIGGPIVQGSGSGTGSVGASGTGSGSGGKGFGTGGSGGTGEGGSPWGVGLAGGRGASSGPKLGGTGGLGGSSGVAARSSATSPEGVVEGSGNGNSGGGTSGSTGPALGGMSGGTARGSVGTGDTGFSPGAGNRSPGSALAGGAGLPGATGGGTAGAGVLSAPGVGIGGLNPQPAAGLSRPQPYSTEGTIASLATPVGGSGRTGSSSSGGGGTGGSGPAPTDPGIAAPAVLKLPPYGKGGTGQPGSSGGPEGGDPGRPEPPAVPDKDAQGRSWAGSNVKIDPSLPLARGGGSGGRKGPSAFAPERAPVPEERARKQQEQPLLPARLGSDGSHVMFVECLVDRIVIYPSRRVVGIDSLNHSPGFNPLFKAVEQMIARRTGYLAAGEKPPRIQVRFLVHRDGERTMHLAYPVLEKLAVEKVCVSLQPEDSVERIVRSSY